MKNKKKLKIREKMKIKIIKIYWESKVNKKINVTLKKGIYLYQSKENI